MLRIENLNRAVRIFLNPERHGELMDTCLQLPDWFDTSFDADSEDFRAQQMQLWREITGRQNYDPLVDEDTPEIATLDAFRRPSFYSTGDAYVAGLHILAMGHILLRSGLREGARVLECGAGFGQNALAFARLGMKVDTIDIGAGYCGAVAQLAKRFDVDLTPHRAPFGTNPAGEAGAYDLILFYESFHHCLDFKKTIPRLVDMLKPSGWIILAGEPISKTADDNMPYPWGIRLHWTNVAVMRQRGWMELGFQEAYLVRQFANAGLAWHLYPDANATTAQVYEFKRWQEPIALSSCSMTQVQATSWHGAEPTGRWTKSRSTIGIPSRDGRIEVELFNHHPLRRQGTVGLGVHTAEFDLASGDRTTIALPQNVALQNQQITITSNVERGHDRDARRLGIFVGCIRPL